MKKTALILFSMILLVAFSSVAFSAETKNNLKIFGGQVVAMDTEHKTFTLKEDKRGTFICTYDDSTRGFSNNQQKTISDMKVGNIAVVVYDEVSGKNLARSITFFEPAR